MGIGRGHGKFSWRQTCGRKMLGMKVNLVAPAGTTVREMPVLPDCRIPRPDDDDARVAALREYDLLDTAAEQDFDFLTELAATICGVPYAFVSLVDAQRVWYKSTYGNKAAVQSPRDDDYCSWSILEVSHLCIPDLTRDARTAGISLTTGAPFYKMYCGANLFSANGHCIGVLCVLDTKPGMLSARQVDLLERLSRQVMALIELRAKQTALAAALDRMEQLATHDELTGLLNRRALMALLQREVAHSRRLSTPLALLMIDLDHFKSINDTHGHAMGDSVLRGVGAILRERVRVSDSAGRYGGEEFCVVLPGANAQGACLLADELRIAIAGAAYAAAGAQVTATASFGVAACAGAAVSDAEQLLHQADRALYQAKAAGRNCICRA